MCSVGGEAGVSEAICSKDFSGYRAYTPAHVRSKQQALAVSWTLWRISPVYPAHNGQCFMDKVSFIAQTAQHSDTHTEYDINNTSDLGPVHSAQMVGGMVTCYHILT